MATYKYLILSTDQEIEVEQKISEPAHEYLEVDGELHRVKRLIAGGTTFALKGTCWASDGYRK